MCDRAPKRHCLENSRAPRCFTGEGPDHLRTHEDPSRPRGHGSLGSLLTAGQRALGVAAANDATSGGRGRWPQCKGVCEGRDASRDTPGKNRPVLDPYQSLRNLESASYENDAYQEKREGTFSGAGDGFDFLC